MRFVSHSFAALALPNDFACVELVARPARPPLCSGSQCHTVLRNPSLTPPTCSPQRTVAFVSGSGLSLLSTHGARNEYIWPINRGISALSFNSATRYGRSAACPVVLPGSLPSHSHVHVVPARPLGCCTPHRCRCLQECTSCSQGVAPAVHLHLRRRCEGGGCYSVRWCRAGVHCCCHVQVQSASVHRRRVHGFPRWPPRRLLGVLLVR
jgi:hypothetical protein